MTSATDLLAQDQVQYAQQLNERLTDHGGDLTRQSRNSDIGQTVNHNIEEISAPNGEEGPLAPDELINEVVDIADPPDQEAPGPTRAARRRGRRVRRRHTEIDGAPKNCPCDACKPRSYYRSPPAPGPPGPYFPAPPAPPRYRRAHARGSYSGSDSVIYAPDNDFPSNASGSDSLISNASGDFDPMKAYIGDVLYLIDYTRRDRRHGGDAQVFKTVHGSEPKPIIPGLDQRKKTENHAIEVRRKIEVDNQNRFVGLEEQPTRLTIRSHYLINVLELVLVDPQSRLVLYNEQPMSTYYQPAVLQPSLAPGNHSDFIDIEEPYEPIVRHLDLLRDFKSNHPDHEDLDVAVAHIELLIGFVTRSIGTQLESESQLRAQETPLTTWKWLWLNFRFGETLYTCSPDPLAYVLSSITGGVLGGHISTSSYYDVACWALEFNGTNYKKVFKTFRIRRFTGSKPINSLPIYPAAFHQDIDGRSLHQELVDRGKKFHKVQKESPSHLEYSGWTLDNPIREIQSRVMIDHELYWREHPPLRAPPSPMGPGGYYSGYSSADSLETETKPKPTYNPYMEGPVIPGPTKPKSQHNKFSGYHKIPKTGELTEHQLLLLPFKIWGWVLKDRRWAELHIKYVAEITPDKDIFDNLILPEDRTEIIKALVQSHKRRGPAKQEPEHEAPTDMPYSADVVKGKGQGLLVLLHGPPGVGKTSTAECVAEYTEKPLFPITCGDLGTEAKGLELHLQHAFGLAQRWGAVLLLDEADVFLERRELSDINRNSLVSVFLRILEYYSGILFLTTNRVGSFDEAFTSRLHVSIHYPALKESERTKIWTHHVNKLERDREDICVRESVREYLESNGELKKIAFNGRQIRNIFQTAVSLAIYEAKIDKRLKGRPTLRSDHLKKVVNLSCEFQDYLRSTRESDSYNAKDAELRDDQFRSKK